ncbi:hypothetical protein GCM10027040_29170 [Halomonas shantousis]
MSDPFTQRADAIYPAPIGMEPHAPEADLFTLSDMIPHSAAMNDARAAV